MNYSNSFFYNLFKGDNFPKDYFNFLLKVMQIFKALKPIMQLKVEIEQIGVAENMGSQCNHSPKKNNVLLSRFAFLICAPFRFVFFL